MPQTPTSNTHAAILDLQGNCDELKCTIASDGTLDLVPTELMISTAWSCSEIFYLACNNLKARGELPDEFLTEIIKTARTTAVHFLEIDDFNSGLE